ncbi:MAG: ThiF family adenylyltransferase [Abditibacteriales bacterium]|nr:ThiF family adenylyltransferase [Abditibacteriales bacterium]MDW8364797.1 ThiF family adenylyltransferase [Abditibacteriales bacterium]
MMSDRPLYIDMQDRYARLRLISWWDQERLAQARVMVVGAGALGNEVLKNLALVGIGYIYLIDYDTIEASNLTRAVLYREAHSGRSKAEVAAAAVRDLNPDCRVFAVHGNVMTDVGLGVFADCDVVIGCLDNRAARLWVNRCCWKVGTPWVDGGIQEISGVVKVFIPPDSACYECAMTENDYRMINLKYACPLLTRDDVIEGKVPTAPTIASIIAGLQTQEALKIIHDLPVQAGQAMVFNGVANNFYTTRYPKREDCLSHEFYPEPIALDLSAEEHSVADLFDAVTGHIDGDVSLRLDRDLLVSLYCPKCDSSREVLRPLTSVGMREGKCPTCGEMSQPQTTHIIAPDSPLAQQPLSRVGVPLYDIVRMVNERETKCFKLAKDKAKVLGV